MLKHIPDDPRRRSEGDHVRVIEGGLLSSMVASSDVIRFQQFERRVRGGLMH